MFRALKIYIILFFVFFKDQQMYLSGSLGCSYRPSPVWITIHQVHRRCTILHTNTLNIQLFHLRIFYTELYCAV